MKRSTRRIILICIIGIAISCDEWVTPWAIIVDEKGNPIPKAKAVCDVSDGQLRDRVADDRGKLVAPYTRGDVKCTISKDGYEPVTTVFILSRVRNSATPN